jgi:hypothetical protein
MAFGGPTFHYLQLGHHILEPNVTLLGENVTLYRVLLDVKFNFVNLKGKIKK